MEDSNTALRIASSIGWAITPEYLAIIEMVCARQTTPAQAVAARDGQPLDNTRTVENRNGVAVIPITGVICRYASFFDDISGAVSVQTLAKDFNAALDDPAIHTIIFLIDSPGGAANGIGEFADMVYAARLRKNIITYVGDTCGSAACWIAAATSRIVMAKMAMIGSIGVLAMADTSEKPNRMYFRSKQSPKKALSPSSESGKAAIQADIDTAGQMFVDAMAQMRGVSVEHVQESFGQGAMMYAAAAIEVGLADEIGSFEGLLTELQQDGSYAASMNAVVLDAKVTARLSQGVQAVASQNQIEIKELDISWIN